LERKMKTQWILGSLVVVAIAGSWALLGGRESHAQTAAGTQKPEVTVAQVLVRSVDDADEFTGRLQAVDTIALRPRVSGYVDSIHFQEGATVKKGQLLFQIDPRPYQAEVDRLSATLAQARAEQVLAQANAERGQRLFAQKAVSREEADRLDTAAVSSKSQVASTEAALESARLNRGFTEILAPIDGRVSNAQITPGNLVTSSDVLTTVVSVDPIYAYFDVDEQSYLKLDRLRRESGKAPVVVMGLADEQGFPHSGRIDFVDNQLRSGSGTIRLRAVFANGDAGYTPGLFVRIQLRNGNKGPRVLIDDRAVGTDLANKYVYVVGKDHKIEYRRVSTGPVLDGLRVINDGLTASDIIVVNGLQRVRPGVEVAPTTVAMDTRSLDAAKQLASGGVDAKHAVAKN
jgi:membrane fusion protein, multidrug efflux system